MGHPRQTQEKERETESKKAEQVRREEKERDDYLAEEFGLDNDYEDETDDPPGRR